MRIQPLVALIDHSTGGHVNVPQLAKALTYQAAYHFRPHWGASSVVVPLTAELAPADAWQLVLLDDSDQAGALGYHDWTPAGLPIGKVFVGTDLQYGALPSVTASHELLEMLADPDISRGYETSNTRWNALEVGDPVEADADGYDVYVRPDGSSVRAAPTSGYEPVRLSNFILPAWFGQNGVPSDGRYDRGGLLKAPLTLRPGGYESYWEGGRWHSINARGEERGADADDSPRYRDRNRVGRGARS